MSQNIKANNQPYFTQMLNAMGTNGIQLRKSRRSYSGQFQIVDSWPEKIDSAVNIIKSKRLVSVDITLKGHKAADQFEKLKENQTNFNQIVGGEVQWIDDLPKERQIVVFLKANPTEKKDWPRQHAWLIAKLAAFRVAFELFKDELV